MTTRAIAALVQIMLDEAAPARRRIEAAEQLLDYEAPPEVAEEAKAFLASIYEGDAPVDLKLDALKLARKAEARKVSRTTVRDEATYASRDPLDIWRCQTMEIWQRKKALLDAGVTSLPDGWDADLRSPDYVPTPEILRAVLEPDTRGLAEALRKARLAHMRKVSVKNS